MDSMKVVPLFKEHGEVLAYWQQKKLKCSCLVLLDKHFDYKKISDDNKKLLDGFVRFNKDISQLNRMYPIRDSLLDKGCVYGLDDFLAAAVYLKMFTSIVWVVPDYYLNEKSLLSILCEHINHIPNAGKYAMTSIACTRHSICAPIDEGVFLTITTLGHLSEMDLPIDTAYDIDLDYFYGLEAKKIDELNNIEIHILKKMRPRLLSISYSMNRGDLPKNYENILNSLKNKINISTKELSTHEPTLIKTMTFLNCKTKPSFLGVYEEIKYLPLPIQKGFITMIYLQQGKLELGDKTLVSAERLGYVPVWSAYHLALAHMQNQNYERALKWIDLCIKGVDEFVKLQAKFLKNNVLFHLKRYDECLMLITELYIKFPLKKDLVLLGINAAQSTKNKWFEDFFRNYLKALNRIFEKGYELFSQPELS